ncbi:hypothetical protein NQ317_014210 [Molorchus minor]|uniref:Protein S-acyltransferase n=1 Tax=Molorchus minor TaxID=1323400 RepID=A0ABQ9JF98_9CUCU|nr:hypothetical protein NQ317_014210 [Molorchus minor]
MVYMVLGVLFIIIFGFDIAYTAIMLSPSESDEPELQGHPVKINKTGAIIPVMDVEYLEHVIIEEHDTEYVNPWRRRAIIYMALINAGVLVALGVLSLWHSQLIGRGETSIEANINKAETVRLAETGKVYMNPYNFGTRKNWKIFLGLVQGRTFLKKCNFTISS